MFQNCGIVKTLGTGLQTPSRMGNLLNEFSYAVDRCSCFMNTKDETTLIFEQQDEQRNVVHDNFYQHLLKEAGF